MPTPHTHFPLPLANAAFIETNQAFLVGEDAARFTDMFEPFVVSGGIHSAGPGLTHIPVPLVAYPAGTYTTETGSITYPDAATTWVICDPATTGDNGSYVRVPGTHYLTATSGPQPTIPVNACPLMGVVTGGGSVTLVQDLRLRGPVQRLALNGIVFSGYYGTLQEAIDALPPQGGTVFVEPGTYVLTSTLTIGNGSSAGSSTRRGVALRGTGSGGTALSVLQWAGGAAPVIQIRGPLIGWAVENIFIHGADVATYGVQVVSGQYGHLEDVEIHGCQVAGLSLTSVATTALGDISISQHNRIANLFITAPGYAAIDLDAPTPGTATMYNTFDNILCFISGNGVGLRLGCAVLNTFTALRTISSGGGNGSIHFAYDNGVNNQRPAGNAFFNLEPGGLPLIQTGTPGAVVPTNLIVGMSPFSADIIPPTIDGVALIYAAAATGSLHLFAAQNPATGYPPVGEVVIGQNPGRPRNLVPELDNMAALGTQTKRWLGAYITGAYITDAYILNAHIDNLVIGGSGSGGGTPGQVVAVVSVDTVLTSDHVVVGVDAIAGPLTITLTAPEGMQGHQYHIKKVDNSANVVTVTAPTAAIDGSPSVTLTAQFDAIHVAAVGHVWYVVGLVP